MALESVPLTLAVANINPDYIQTCIELGCTGAGHECRLEPGTVTLIRRTAGGLGKRLYGVVGLWAFSGKCEPVSRRDRMWPARWDKKIIFEPLVREFSEPWCEDFSRRPAPGQGGRNQSVYVRGLTFIMLQGSIVRIRDIDVAMAYIDGLIRARGDELKQSVNYRGETTTALELLDLLKNSLKKSKAATTC